jgi:hypothetical protein
MKELLTSLYNLVQSCYFGLFQSGLMAGAEFFDVLAVNSLY